jgi:hypothetical protein
VVGSPLLPVSNLPADIRHPHQLLNARRCLRGLLFLPARYLGNPLDPVRLLRDATPNALQGLLRFVGQLRQSMKVPGRRSGIHGDAVDVSLEGLNQPGDVLDCLLRAEGQSANFLGHHAKSLLRGPHLCGLYLGIEGEHLRLSGNALNQLDQAPNLL